MDKVTVYILIVINIIIMGLGYYSGWHDKELRINKCNIEINK